MNFKYTFRLFSLLIFFSLTLSIFSQEQNLNEASSDDSALTSKAEETVIKQQATPEEKPASTPEEKPASTPEEKPASTPEEKPASTPEDKPASTPEEKPASTPEEKPTLEKELNEEEANSIVAIVFVIFILLALIYVIIAIVRGSKSMPRQPPKPRKKPRSETDNSQRDESASEEVLSSDSHDEEAETSEGVRSEQEPIIIKQENNEQEEKNVSTDGEDDLTKQLKNVVLKKIAEWLNKLNASINTINKKSEAGFKKIEKETSELVMATAKLNSVIENQQKEIERYKKGYDYSIRKDSFTPLLQLDDLIKNILNEPDINEQTIEKLNSVEKYISSYLEERDIESFEFEVGKSYRDLPADEFEIEEIVDTDDQKFNEKIERIIKEGYCNIHPNGKNILRKVKISVYKYKGE